MNSTIIFLPPFGPLQPETPWANNLRQMARAKAALKAAEAFPKALLVISGGHPNHRDFSEADVFATTLWLDYPELMPDPKRLVVDSAGARTVESLVESLPYVRGFWLHDPVETQVLIATELPHYIRVWATMKNLGYRPGHIESDAGDWQPLYDKDYRELEWAATISVDESLGRDPVSIDRGQKAADRARAKLPKWNKWAEANPGEDAGCEAEVRNTLRHLVSLGAHVRTNAVL
ncbi:MAG: ElyC/SanA/YdcF family protein [Candidatus Paceibacterota bacterium]